MKLLSIANTMRASPTAAQHAWDRLLLLAERLIDSDALLGASAAAGGGATAELAAASLTAEFICLLLEGLSKQGYAPRTQAAKDRLRKLVNKACSEAALRGLMKHSPNCLASLLLSAGRLGASAGSKGVELLSWVVQDALPSLSVVDAAWGLVLLGVVGRADGREERAVAQLVKPVLWAKAVERGLAAASKAAPAAPRTVGPRALELLGAVEAGRLLGAAWALGMEPPEGLAAEWGKSPGVWVQMSSFTDHELVSGWLPDC